MRAYDGLDLAAPQIGIQTIPTTPEKAMSLDSDLKISDIVYVKFQTRKREGDEYILGFMTPYDPNDAAFKDRKVTVDRWSEGWSKEGKNILNSASWVGVNESLTGFKILHTVSRSRTSNKVWRVLDPRGFELEIMTENLDFLFNHCDVKDRVLQGSLIWLTRFRGGTNWLVPEGHPATGPARVLSESKRKAKTGETLRLSDIDRGDTVRLGDGRLVRYYGSMWSELIIHYGSSLIKRHQWFEVLDTESNRMLGELGCRKQGSGLDFMTSLTVVERVEESPMTDEEAEMHVNELLGTPNKKMASTSFVRCKKFRREDLVPASSIAS